MVFASNIFIIFMAAVLPVYVLAAMVEEAEALTPEWRRRYGPAD